ncbi:hypothetical protein MKX01_033607 [Papaver californicum]|nr:hypothetical protein MKX01_033607 [Papaver californicum]
MRRRPRWLLTLKKKPPLKSLCCCMPTIETFLAQLEAELKLARQEMAKLWDDIRELNRLIKPEEAILLGDERTIQGR